VVIIARKNITQPRRLPDAISQSRELPAFTQQNLRFLSRTSIDRQHFDQHKRQFPFEAPVILSLSWQAALLKDQPADQAADGAEKDRDAYADQGQHNLHRTG
jgi:hypothetical protein